MVEKTQNHFKVEEHRARYFEAITDPAYVVDQQSGAFLDVNAAAAETYGYTREEMLALNVSEISAEPEAAFRTLANPEAVNLRLHKRKDGTTFHVEFSARVVEWGGRTVLVGVARDVSPRTRVEQALRDSETLLSTAFHHSPLLMSVSDLTTDRYTEVNETFASLIGHTKEEIVGQTAVELGLITVSERDLLAEQLMASLGKSSIELVIRRKNGKALICKYWGTIVPTATGPKLFAAAEDITERKQAEEALATSERRFELAMEATTDGLWDWDISTGAAYFSPGYYRMLGFETDTFEASATTWQDLVHPDDRALSQRHAEDCIEGRTERFEFEYRLRSKGGDWRWILTRGKCVARDEHGRALRLLGTHVDTTERKRLQAGLAQSDRLGTMGMLAAGVAHEINNPLAYVQANLDILSQDVPRLLALTDRLTSALRIRVGEEALAEALGDGREFVTAAARQDMITAVESALEGTRRITKISRGLGTFALVEKPELETVDVNFAIETAVTMAHNEVKYRATLVKDFGHLPPVLATDGKLAQVFLNLIINASHAIDEGHAERNRITVRTWAEADSVFAEVEDTGSGIPPENLTRIFEPFFTTKTVGLGSGLGLSISRNIIAEFGGDIRVESEVGVGTRVRVRLPVNAKRAEKIVEPTVVEAVTPGGRGRVLVVDDEEAIRKILVRVLTPQHEVVTSASGREAKALLERDPAFDVILCDLMMPEMTGMDLHAWLVKEHPTLAWRCVFISGGAFTPSASEYLASVPHQRINKPFDLTLLRRAVADMVVAVKRGA